MRFVGVYGECGKGRNIVRRRIAESPSKVGSYKGPNRPVTENPSTSDIPRARKEAESSFI